MKRLYNTKIITTNFLFGLFSTKAIRLAVTALTMSFATAPIAAWNNSTDTTPDYVDSVHKWGAWELDIEPAAGGLKQSSTQQVNARDSRASLRTNSVSALSPSAAIPPSAAMPRPIPTPVGTVGIGPAGPVGPTAPAPAAATPPTTIIVNLPATSNARPIVSPVTPPTGNSGLF
jgi:hypothetical protein